MNTNCPAHITDNRLDDRVQKRDHSTADWRALLPGVVDLVVQRTDAPRVGAVLEQIGAASTLLSQPAYRAVTGAYPVEALDGLIVFAALFTVGRRTSSGTDLLEDVLTEYERDLVDEYAEVMESVLDEDDAPVEGGIHYVRALERATGLAAAEATAVRVSQKPVRYKFALGTNAGEAQVEVQLGGGPLLIRQLGGPDLKLVEGAVRLPTRDVVAVDVNDGENLTQWLKGALDLAGRRASAPQRP
jgi:hypothetical protein